MNRDIKFTATLWLVALLTGLSQAEGPRRVTDEAQEARRKQLEDRAAVVKPIAKELAWLKIPWVLDLKAAQMAAEAEGRPLFLWVTGDDPLERC